MTGGKVLNETVPATCCSRVSHGCEQIKHLRILTTDSGSGRRVAVTLMWLAPQLGHFMQEDPPG